MGMAVGAFFGMGPVASQQSGFSDAQTGTILSAALIGALAFQWPLGWLSDLMDRRVIIFGSSTVGALVALLFVGTLAQEGELWAILLAFLMGGALMPLYSICLAEVNDRIEESELIAAASAFVLVYGVGSAVGPFAASLAMGQIGPSGLFVFVAAVLGFFAAFDALRIRQRKKTDTRAKQSYVATPSTSHAVLPLHEHGPDRAEGEAAPR